MTLEKQLLDKLAKSEHGCTHLDFDADSPLSNEQTFNEVLGTIRGGAGGVKKDVTRFEKLNDLIKDKKPLSMDDIDDIEAVKS